MVDWDLNANVEGKPVVKKYKKASEIAGLIEAQTGKKVKVVVSNENGVVSCFVDESKLDAAEVAKVRDVLSGL